MDAKIAPMDAADFISALELQPHPEGGFYRETWRAPTVAGERATGTAIYYLLESGPRSRWHHIDATEIWHYYAGGPLILRLARDGAPTETLLLGPDLELDQQPQIVIPPHVWQSASSLGEFTLVGCTVSPGFEFSGFTIAEPGWRPAPP